MSYYLLLVFAQWTFFAGRFHIGQNGHFVLPTLYVGGDCNHFGLVARLSCAVEFHLQLAHFAWRNWFFRVTWRCATTSNLRVGNYQRNCTNILELESMLYNISSINISKLELCFLEFEFRQLAWVSLLYFFFYYCFHGRAPACSSTSFL